MSPASDRAILVAMEPMPIPQTTQRADDLGWIASTPPTYPFRFAVIGNTEAEAKARFEEAVKRWESLDETVKIPIAAAI